MHGVTAQDGQDTVRRYAWSQNLNSSDTLFISGQFWRLEDYAITGFPILDDILWQTVPPYEELSLRNDLFSFPGAGLGAEDIRIAFPTLHKHSLIYSINVGLPAALSILEIIVDWQSNDPDFRNKNRKSDFIDAYAWLVPACFCIGHLVEADIYCRTVDRGDLITGLSAETSEKS